MTDEIRKRIEAGDPIGALDAALREAGARPTLDRHRSMALPCYICGEETAPRTLVQIGTYTRRMGGNLQPGDRIERPLCARCDEATCEEPRPRQEQIDKNPVNKKHRLRARQRYYIGGEGRGFCVLAPSWEYREGPVGWEAVLAHCISCAAKLTMLEGAT